MLNFPPQVKVEEINQMHPWRAGLGPVWENARLLHDGGHRLSNSAGNFIIRRFMEPETIYRERLKHFTSEGIVKGGVNVDRFGGAKIDQLAGIQRFAWDGWNGA